MFKQGKKAILTVVILLFAVVMSSVALAADGVNWEQNVITVTGMGVAPSNATSAAQARMMARRAAVVDGYRQLAEIVKGVNVDAQTTVQNMMVVNDVVNTKVSALIQGAKVVGEQVTPDGGYEVTMQVAMFGVSNSLAEIVMPQPKKVEPFPTPDKTVAPAKPNLNVSIEITTTTVKKPAPAPEKKQQSLAAAAPAGTAIGGFTGLIVDCRGLNLQPVMSPVIKNDNGQPIYGYKNLNYKKVISNGMAGYATDMNKASRAGSNPLVVKAVRIDGFGNPVISVADANRVLIENGATGFLDNTKVVFIR